jgi:hypothetical protein
MVAGLAGCALDGANVGSAFVDPSKFIFYQCDDLNRRAQGLVTREKQLREDMAKAEQGAAGELISTLAYRTDYLAVRGEMNLLQKTAADKKCELRLVSPGDGPIR